MNKSNGNNRVSVNGKVVSGFEFDYEIFGEKFYRFYLEIPRKSNVKDVIPVIVSERLIDITGNYEDCAASVSGQYRSFNRHEGNKSSLILSVFAQEIEFMEQLMETHKNNIVELEGFICSESTYRTTPLGREIADVLLAVNRDFGKSDYIPCIFWARNAKYVANFSVGTRIKLVGRIQSRDYIKRTPNGEELEKVAYEVSVKTMEVVENV